MKPVNVVLTTIAVVFTTLTVVGLIKKPGSVYESEPEEQNPFKNRRVRFVEDENDDINADGVRGYLEIVSDAHTPRRRSFYERYVKRCIDIILSGLGLILLSPVFAVISILVYMDDPGPVLFTQKRVGRNKAFFRLHKFRSMKINTPANIPTHMLENPDEYITRVGRVLRKTSLDERVIIGQTTENLENKGFREVSPIHFHRGHDLFFYNAGYANYRGRLCQSA